MPSGKIGESGEKEDEGMGSEAMVSRQGRDVLNRESRGLSTGKPTPSPQEEGRKEELKLGTWQKTAAKQVLGEKESNRVSYIKGPKSFYSSMGLVLGWPSQR